MTTRSLPAAYPPVGMALQRPGVRGAPPRRFHRAPGFGHPSSGQIVASVSGNIQSFPT